MIAQDTETEAANDSINIQPVCVVPPQAENQGDTAPILASSSTDTAIRLPDNYVFLARNTECGVWMFNTPNKPCAHWWKLGKNQR